MVIINFIRGVFMAMADSVPGVSGGTIAFILGFYDEFIGSLNALSSKSTLDEKKDAVRFLFKIGIGWVFGFIVSVFFLASIFEEQIYSISSLFVGFIIFSIPLIIKEEKETLKERALDMVWTITGILVVVSLTIFNPVTSGGGINISIGSFSFGLIFYVFVAGMIAISAMVLPGISGSTLLLIFGLYSAIISAVKEVLMFNFEYLPMLVVFASGVLVGILTTIRVIRHFLVHSRPTMIYLIIGLMIGSIYAVFMGPMTLEIPQPAMNLTTFDFVFFVIGGLIILGLEQFSNRMTR